MEIREGLHQGIRPDHKQFLYPLIQESYSTLLQDIFDSPSLPMDKVEVQYTKCAHFMGKKLKEKFSGLWVCICGSLTSQTHKKTTTLHFSQQQQQQVEETIPEFSFAVPSALRFITLAVNRQCLIYIAQIYDPVAPAAKSAQKIDEWNLN